MLRRSQALYFLSSFFGQFGPNATTWLLPGEVFPTDIRATCHGISAATGKVGALVAGIWFAYLTNAGKFYVAAFFNLVGPSPAFPLPCTAPPPRISRPHCQRHACLPSSSFASP